MSKTLIRCVAFLLVPCLIADPITASAFSGPSPIPASRPNVSLFASQAMAGRDPFTNPHDFYSPEPTNVRAEVFRSFPHVRTVPIVLCLVLALGAAPRAFG